jgi:hypothetical protein
MPKRSLLRDGYARDAPGAAARVAVRVRGERRSRHELEHRRGEQHVKSAPRPRRGRLGRVRREACTGAKVAVLHAAGKGIGGRSVLLEVFTRARAPQTTRRGTAPPAYQSSRSRTRHPPCPGLKVAENGHEWMPGATCAVRGRLRCGIAYNGQTMSRLSLLTLTFVLSALPGCTLTVNSGPGTTTPANEPVVVREPNPHHHRHTEPAPAPAPARTASTPTPAPAPTPVASTEPRRFDDKSSVPVGTRPAPAPAPAPAPVTRFDTKAGVPMKAVPKPTPAPIDPAKQRPKNADEEARSVKQF